MENIFCKTTYKTATRNWFNRWSNEYDQTLGKISFHRELLNLVVRNSGVKNCSKVLDIGCVVQDCLV